MQLNFDAEYCMYLLLVILLLGYVWGIDFIGLLAGALSALVIPVLVNELRKYIP